MFPSFLIFSFFSPWCQTFGKVPDYLELMFMLGRNLPATQLRLAVNDRDFARNLRDAIAPVLEIPAYRVQVMPVRGNTIDPSAPNTGIQIVLRVTQ